MPRLTQTERSEPPIPTPAGAAAIPAQVRLLLLLCRVLPPADEVARLCEDIRDWEFFLQLARHHRVTPLVARNAAGAGLPEVVRQELRTRAAANGVQAFRYLAELQRLLGLLASAGIQPTVLKGVPLSLQAFGDVATRDIGDIDLLIQPEDASLADELLQANGFVRNAPAARLTPRRRASYARHFKDYTYEPLTMQTQGGFEVDLHWRLFRNPLMPGNDLTEGDKETLTVGPLSIQTLSPPTHLLYLSVLGALDGWTRFKSVADIAAMWDRSDKPAVLEQARASAVLPYLFAALVLVEGWIGGIDLPLHFDLQASLKHPVTRLIVERARVRMQGFLPALRDTDSWTSKRYEASLDSRLSYKWGIAQRILLRPRAWERFDLPDALFPLYPLLSPVEWLLFHGNPLSSRAQEKRT